MRTLKTALAAALLAVGGAAQADVVLTGNFLTMTINSNGYIGQGNDSPGLIFDRTGTGTFDPLLDYIAPGIPFEAFGVKIGGGGTVFNSNSGSSSFTTVGDATNTSSGSTLSATWSGTLAGVLNISHTYSFGQNDQNLRISTTITALSDLDDVRFARAVDPDPDNTPTGTAETNNQRGNADPSLRPQDFVFSTGRISGQPLGLFSGSAINHNTGLSSNCCSTIDPDFYLDGGNLGNSSVGDHGIGIGFDLGNLNAGESVNIEYFYVTAGSVGEIEVPGGGGGTVPLPGTLALLGLGALALGRKRR